MFDDKKHEQTFPLLAPPLIARVEKNKRNKYVEQGEDYGTMLNWHEYERGMGKWCVKWSIDELLANPERLGSLAVVAGWIAGEEDVL